MQRGLATYGGAARQGAASLGEEEVRRDVVAGVPQDWECGLGLAGDFGGFKAGAAHAKNLAKKYGLKLKRSIAMGHSASSQLALYLGAEVPWVAGVISLAGVADLRRAEESKLSRNVVRKFLGGPPEEYPERYKLASPIERVPLGKPTVPIHSEKDTVVPVQIARRYEAAAKTAGDKVKLVTLAEATHFDLIDPASAHWAAVERSVLEMLQIS